MARVLRIHRTSLAVEIGSKISTANLGSKRRDGPVPQPPRILFFFFARRMQDVFFFDSEAVQANHAKPVGSGFRRA